MEPFDLAGRGGRPWLGEPLADGVLAAQLLEEDLGRAGLGEPARELLAIVSEDLGGHAVAAKRGSERLAHRASAGLHQHRGDDDEPGVVVDAGEQLALAAVGQQHPAHQVELPQLHRRLPLPALVVARVLLPVLPQTD